MRRIPERLTDVELIGLILERRAGHDRTFPSEGTLTTREQAIVRAFWNRRTRDEGYLGRERRHGQAA